MSSGNEMSDPSSSLGEHNQLFKNPESKLNQFVTSVDPETSKPEPYGDDEEGEFQEGSISKQEGGLDEKEEDSGDINEEDIRDDQEEQDNEENCADEIGEGEENQEDPEADVSENEKEFSSEKLEEMPSASG